MNCIERFLYRQIKKYAWHSFKLTGSLSNKKIRRKIEEYRWIIQDSNKNIIYDTEQSGYDGLYEYHTVVESLPEIQKMRNMTEKRSKQNSRKQDVIIVIDTKLLSIFPSKSIENKCVRLAV